jgi:hypothetical protein
VRAVVRQVVRDVHRPSADVVARAKCGSPRLRVGTPSALGGLRCTDGARRCSGDRGLSGVLTDGVAEVGRG